VSAFTHFNDEFHDARGAWEKQYKKGYFLGEPIQEELPAIIQRFKSHGVSSILDLGCGSGRHTVYLAKQGFDVFAVDIAPTGLDVTMQKLAAQDLKGHMTLADILHLPYQDRFFDAIISIRVIHHNRVAIIRNTVAEIWRVLRPQGLVWITVPVPKGHSSRGGQEIEPGTWIPDDGIEKGLPHHLFTEPELHELFQHFTILDFRVFSMSHYSLLAEKPTK
jgi:SAM-dependent methyltransferase